MSPKISFNFRGKKMSQLVDFISLLVSQKGDKYVFGVEVPSSDSNPLAFDCSELVEWGCARMKIKPTMPDGSWSQATHCKKHGLIISTEKAILTPGALLFIFSSSPFDNKRPNSAHIAVSLGNVMTIEARSAKKGVGVFSVDARGWTHAGLIPGLDYAGD
jgi:cell wall-associated NlpC family hydrolase